MEQRNKEAGEQRSRRAEEQKSTEAEEQRSRGTGRRAVRQTAAHSATPHKVLTSARAAWLTPLPTLSRPRCGTRTSRRESAERATAGGITVLPSRLGPHRSVWAPLALQRGGDLETAGAGMASARGRRCLSQRWPYVRMNRRTDGCPAAARSGGGSKPCLRRCRCGRSEASRLRVKLQSTARCRQGEMRCKAVLRAPLRGRFTLT